MQIRIINQEKNAIIDCNGKDIRIRNKEIFCIEGTNNLSAISLGKYKTEEKAKEVFDTILLNLLTNKKDNLIITIPEE